MTDPILVLLMIVVIAISFPIFLALRFAWELLLTVWLSIVPPDEPREILEEEIDLMRKGVRDFTDTEPHL